MAEAAEAWRKSLARQPSAWAYRNLAVLARHEGRAGEAADLYLRAAELKPDLPELQTECGRALTEAGRFADLDRWLDGLPQAVRRSGRIEMLAARAATERGDLAGAEAILERIELADVREGEIALTDLWFSIQEKRLAAAEGVPIDDALKERVRRTLQPPKRLDYRMSQA
jgi:tetratricopeptide (TPR) repeat protein